MYQYVRLLQGISCLDSCTLTECFLVTEANSILLKFTIINIYLVLCPVRHIANVFITLTKASGKAQQTISNYSKNENFYK